MSGTYRSSVHAIPGNLWRTVTGTFDFRGRSTRTEVWTYQLLAGLTSSVLAFCIVRITGEVGTSVSTVASSLSTLLVAAPTTAQIARRLHDIDRSGWWSAFFPLVLMLAVMSENWTPSIAGVSKYDLGWPATIALLAGMYAFLVISLAPADDSSNPYGPNPRLVDAQ